MQPTYLPWYGYFEIIQRSDDFVFLDDVKFEKSSWHTRNQIICNGKPHFITIPTTGSRYQMLNEVKFQTTFKWKEKHLKMIRMSYVKTPFFKDIFPSLEKTYLSCKTDSLTEFNISIIKFFSDYLKLNTNFHLSSELDINSPRTQRLVDITNHFKADTYYSPIGSKKYIEEDGDFSNSNLTLQFQRFYPKPYSQYKTDQFYECMSIFDICCNMSKEDVIKYLLECS